MAEDSRKLFVAGLPETITEDVLKQLFEATGGAVVDVSLPKHRETGRPRGFGFVTLSTEAEANVAREALHGSFQGGKSISVRPFQSEAPKRDAAPAAAEIYVGNLPYDVTNEELEGLITGAGAPAALRVNLPTEPDGRKRGFGFVTMSTPEAATNAIQLLNGASLRGRRLVVNLRQPRGERPPRDDRFSGPPSGRDFGGPPSGGFAPGGGGFGGPRPPPDRNFGPPAPARKTFDDRRRKPHDDGGGAGGTKGRRNKNDWDTGKADWDDD